MLLQLLGLSYMEMVEDINIGNAMVEQAEAQMEVIVPQVMNIAHPMMEEYSVQGTSPMMLTLAISILHQV